MSKRSYFEWRRYYKMCLYFIHPVKSVNHLRGGISIYWHLGKYNLLSCKESNASRQLAQLWVQLCPGKNALTQFAAAPWCKSKVRKCHEKGDKARTALL